MSNIKFTFTYIWKNGRETQITVPGKFIVCEECDGTGTALIEGLRGVAFTSDEMDEDPDFRENYFGGNYDTECPCCNGARVTMVPNEMRMTKRQKLLWHVAEREQLLDENERRYERMLRERGVQW